MKTAANFAGLVFVATAACAPLLLVLRMSLFEAGGSSGFYKPDTITLRHYTELAEAPIRFTVGFAGLIAVSTTILALAFSLWFLALPARWHMLALMVLLVPKFGGALCYAFGLQRLLPRGTLAALIAEVSFVLPYAVLAVLSRLLGPTPELILAARGLGANRWQVFRRVVWPQGWPGVFVALVLSLAWGLGAMVGPMLLATPAHTTLAAQLQIHVAELRWPVAAAEGVTLIVATLVLFAIPAPTVRV